jgi:hypothetical protein
MRNPEHAKISKFVVTQPLSGGFPMLLPVKRGGRGNRTNDSLHL